MTTIRRVGLCGGLALLLLFVAVIADSLAEPAPGLCLYCDVQLHQERMIDNPASTPVVYRCPQCRSTFVTPHPRGR